MANPPYTPPGFNVQELYSPSVSSVVADDSQVAVVGLAQGYQTGYRDVILAPSTASFDISPPGPPTSQASLFYAVSSTQRFVSVRDSVNPTQGLGAQNSGYVEGVALNEVQTITVTGSPGTGELPANTYYYVVTALNANGETVKSNEQSITTTGTSSAVTVSWGAVTGATSYRIYRGTAAAGENLYFTVGAVTTFTDTGGTGTAGTPPATSTAVINAPIQTAGSTSATGGTGLTASTAYYYVITATTAAGETIKSNEVTLTTATGTTNSNVLNWAPVTSATGYRIYRGTAAGSESVYYAVGAVTTYTDTGAASTAGTPPVANTASITAPTQATATTAAASGGTFTLSFSTATSAPIAYNASAPVVQTALQALTTIGPGNALVTGSAGGPWTVTFSGTLAASSQSLIAANGSGLIGGTSPGVTVVRTTAGSPAGDFSTAPSTTVGAPQGTITVTPNTSSLLYTSGGSVRFTFNYVPLDYYQAVRLGDQASVEARFGPALSTTGVANPLSFATQCAFENGAASIVCQPLFLLADPLNTSSQRLQPTAAGVANPTTWNQTYTSLRGYDNIRIIVPAVGQSSTLNDSAMQTILAECLRHQSYMVTQAQYITAVMGEDSSVDNTQANAATLRAHADQLYSNYPTIAQQAVLVAPSRFRRALPGGSGGATRQTTTLVGGQYIAAAVAGMIAGRPVSATLTRKQIGGFVEVSDPRSKDEKNNDASHGLMVIEQKGLNLQVRHAITLDVSGPSRRELSVVRAKYHMIESITETLDSQVIGQVPADGNAPTVVKAAVIGVLENLRNRLEIVNYSGVQARQLADPTAVEVRFSYLPAFPLNYINIVFSLDLTAGGSISTGFTPTAA